MTVKVVTIIVLCLVNGAVALLLAPLFEGIMRKLKALVHSRIGPPITQPYRDILKLLGKEDLRTATGYLYRAAPALTLASILLLAMFVPLGTAPPLGFGGDIIVLLYVAGMGAVLVMMAAFGSSSPYAYMGSSREMMLLLTVEPVLAIALLVGAVNAQTLQIQGIMAWQLDHGPSLSMVIAAMAFFLALQAQAAKLPFDMAEADQEIMGGPLIEQSGPRLALFRWAIWTRQLVFAMLFVGIFVPWPQVGFLPLDMVLSLVKVAIVLVVVGVIDAVNPRLRIDQAMATFVRVGFVALAGLAFAVIGI